MDKKILAIAVVAIVVVAGIAAAVILMNKGDEQKEQILTHRLLLMGNVYSDDTINDNDVTVLQAMVDGKEKIKVAGNEIDLTTSDIKKYADVNQDKKIDSKDISTLKDIINGKATKVFYENAKGEITSVKVPMNNLLIMFRRVGTTVAMVGASDMVKGFISDLAPGGNYGFLGFKGENLGSGSEPDYEKIKEMDSTYKSSGGVTLIADATGSAANLEEKVGPGIDVVRMPVTEGSTSEHGVVTLGYLLAYNNDNHDQIMEKLNKWISWTDSAKKTILDAVAKMKDADKKTCIVGMYNASASTATINIRGPGQAEHDYSVECGGNNLCTGKGPSYTYAELNEYLLSANPEYVFIMQQETYLLKSKISAQTTYDEFMTHISDNYKGKIGVFSQFFGSGPGYILSMMYYANVLVPELKDHFDLEKEYKFFMGDLVGNKELAEISAFVPMSS